MAIFRHGSLTGGISGSVGGVTFVNGRGSPVLRHRPIRPAPKGPGIELAQKDMNILNSSWSNFTDAQRDAWRTAAVDFARPNRLGVQSPLTGHQLFLKINIELHDFGGPLFSGPPAGGQSPAPENFSVALSASGALTWSGDPPPGESGAIFFMFGKLLFTPTPPKNSGPMNFLLRFAAASINQNLRPQIEKLWGAPVEGQTMVCGLAATQGAFSRSPVVVLIEQVGA